MERTCWQQQSPTMIYTTANFEYRFDFKIETSGDYKDNQVDRNLAGKCTVLSFC